MLIDQIEIFFTLQIIQTQEIKSLLNFIIFSKMGMRGVISDSRKL